MSRNRRISSAVAIFAQVFVLAVIMAVSHWGVGAGATGAITVNGVVTFNSTDESNVSVYAINTSTNAEYGPTSTDSNGQYSLNVDAGTYNFYFIPPSGSGLSSVVDNGITITANQTVSVQLYQAQTTHIFSGYIYDQNGAPVPGINVELGNGNSSPVASGVTNSSGFYTMTVAAGSYMVNFGGSSGATWDGYPLANFTMASFESPGNTDISVDLTTTDVSQSFTFPFDTLTVNTTDGSGDPIGASFSGSGSGSVAVTTGSNSYTISQSVGYSIYTGSAGTTTFAMPEGADFLSLCANYANGTNVCNTQGNVDTRAGSASTTLSEPASHIFSGYIYDQNGAPVSGVNVELVNAPGSNRVIASGATNASGFYTMVVQAGTYSVDFGGGGNNGATWSGYPIASFTLDSFDSPGNTNIPEDLTTTNVSQNFTIPFDTLTVNTTDGSGNPVGASVTGTGFASAPVTSAGDTYTISQSANFSLNTSPTGTAVIAMPQGAIFTTLCASFVNGTQVCDQNYPSTVNGSISDTLSEPAPPATYTISGYIYDQNGAPVSGVNVELGNGNNPSSVITSDVTGTTGFYTMTATAGTYSIDFTGSRNAMWDGYPLASFNMTSYESPGNTDIPVNITTTDVSQNFTIPFDTLTVVTNDNAGNPTSASGTASGTGSVAMTAGGSDYIVSQNVSDSFNTGPTGTITFAMPQGAAFLTNPCVTYLTGQVCYQGGVDTRNGSAIVVFQQNGSVVSTPSAPTGLTATSPTNQLPYLTWDTVSGATSYNVYLNNGTKIGTTSNTYFTDNNPTQGSNTYYVTAVNGVGESGPSNSASVIYDTSPPTITYSVSSAPNSAGWYNSSVIVTFTCSDPTTGVTVTSCSAPVTLTSDGSGQTVIGTAVDSAGNTASVTSAPINIDQTPPTITYTLSPAPSNNGWNNSPVTVTYNCTDNTGGSGIVSYTQPQIESTDGQYNLTGTCTDNAGNTASISVPVNLDQTAPTLGTPSWVSNPVTVGSNTTLEVPASDNLSGVVGGEYYIGSTDPGQGSGTPMMYNSATGNLCASLGASLAPGTYQVNVRAEDAAGNWSSITTTTLTINSAKPTVGTISAPATVAKATSFNASGTFTDTGATGNFTAQWNWGDGTTSTGTVTNPSGSNPGSVASSHSYTNPGSYIITLSVTNADGLTAANTITIAVSANNSDKFSGANMTGLNYSGADLSSLDISGSNMQNGIFNGTNFTGSSLAGNNAPNASFQGANFTSANLSGATFQGANFTGANFTSANLKGANFKSAIVTNVTWLHTVCPNGTNSDSDGGSCVGEGGGL